jgi:methylated-DNA-[protein]-cysteine S-methyltransferase
LVGARLPGRWRYDASTLATTRWPGAVRDDTILRDVQQALRAYAEGTCVQFDFPIDLSDVPPFRRKVLEACRAVGYGERTTYAELALRAGNPAAMRAAGGAMANNPIPLVIPCHRVLRSDGRMGGFSADGGLELKRRMLAWEDAHMEVGV